MQDAIWTKQASYGTVETNGAIVTVNGKMVGNGGPAVKLPESKWITKDGTTYTHLIGLKVALTTEEAAAHDAAYDAKLKATRRYTPNVVDDMYELGREMDRAASAL